MMVPRALCRINNAHLVEALHPLQIIPGGSNLPHSEEHLPHNSQEPYQGCLHTMARFNDMGEWRIVQDHDDSAPLTRRTRRGVPSANIYPSLTRDSDKAVLSVGDSIFINSDASGELDFLPEVEMGTNAETGFAAVITSLALALLGKAELWVLPMVNAEALENSDSSNNGGNNIPEVRREELNDQGLTKDLQRSEVDLGIPGREYVLLSKNIRVDISQISRKVDVKSRSQCRNGSDLFCCRAADLSLEHVSEPFDYSEWVELLKADYALAVFAIAEKTLIIVSPRKRAVVESSRKRKPSKKPVSYAESSESDPEAELESESESEADSESEAESISTPRKKRTLQGKNETPRRSNRDSARGSDMFQQVVDVLSPVNRWFKVKTGSQRSSLPSFSRGNSDMSDTAESPASEAFLELKEKLHTSTRVNHLPCREEQFDELYMNLESAIMEQIGTCIYISGMPGVGKTATIREVVAALRDNVQSGYVDEFDFLEINSLKLLTPNSAYEKLWDHLTGIKVTPSNAALLLEEYFSRGKDIKKPLIILMDELDQLVTKNQKVIYNFFNWPTYQHSKLIVIAVANTMDLPERVFSNKIASRLGLRRIAFRGYTEEQLGTIIENRLRMLSETNKRIVEITPDAMRFASKKVAIVSGDARRALTICRRAVEIAEREYLETANMADVPEAEQSYGVKIEHIGIAITETVNSPTARLVQTLPFASKLLLVGVLLRMRRSGCGENPLGDILDEMKNTLMLETKTLPLLGDIPADTTMVSLLYGGDIRMRHLSYVVNDLVDQGLLTQQNVRSERYRSIALNISEDELRGLLRKDREVGHMI